MNNVMSLRVILELFPVETKVESGMSSSNSDHLIIGIAGASCSGKSGLARELCITHKNCISISQDDFYLEFDQVPKSKENIPLWDVPEAIDSVQFVQAVSEAAACTTQSLCQTKQSGSKGDLQTHVIIVEGTMILSLKELRDLLDVIFFITLDYNTFMTRRKSRDYGQHKDTPGYLEQHVWPSYLRELETVKSLFKDPILPVMMDGLQKEKKLYSIVKERISHLLTLD